MSVRELYNVLCREDGQKILIYKRGEKQDIVESMDKEINSFIFNETFREYVIYLK